MLVMNSNVRQVYKIEDSAFFHSLFSYCTDFFISLVFVGQLKPVIDEVNSTINFITSLMADPTSRSSDAFYSESFGLKIS
jgi:hypothetical protein